MKALQSCPESSVTRRVLVTALVSGNAQFGFFATRRRDRCSGDPGLQTSAEYAGESDR
jgi:hypothetical protein